MSDDHETLLADVDLVVVEEKEYFFDTLVEKVWESIEEICESNDDVSFDSPLDVAFDKGEECV